MRGQQLINEYAPGVKRWRDADYVKKASRRRRGSKLELPYNTDNFLNKYYQQRQGDVINYLSRKYNSNKPRHSVEGTLLARSTRKKQE